MAVPKLRFAGFNDEWKTYTLSDILSLIGGNAFSSKDASKNGVKWLKIANVGFGNVTWDVQDYLPLNFKDKYPNYLLDCGDIILTLTRPILNGNLKIAQITSKDLPALLNQRVAKLQINEGMIDKKYIFHLLRNRKTVLEIESSISGTDPPNLGNKELKKILVNIPLINESIKIAKFMDTVDKKIQLQQEKINLLKEQKKGFMQKIFSQELRFKDEDGQAFPEWEGNIKASELFESISNKNHNSDYAVLSATQNQGMVYRESLERNMSFDEGNLNTYKLVEVGDFIISLRSFQGGIEFSNLEGLVSPAYTVFRSISPKVDAQYFAKFFKTSDFIQRLNSTTYGIRDGKAISFNDFCSLKFSLPSIQEQEKIASFLNILDKKITTETCKLNQIELEKQYFMQQMFI